MSAVAALLARLAADGLALRAEEEALVVSPAEKLTPELRALLLRFKPEVLGLLRIHGPGLVALFADAPTWPAGSRAFWPRDGRLVASCGRSRAPPGRPPWATAGARLRHALRPPSLLRRARGSRGKAIRSRGRGRSAGHLRGGATKGAPMSRRAAAYQLLPPPHEAAGGKVSATGRFCQVLPPPRRDKDYSRRAKDDGPFRPIDWPINGRQETPC